MAADRAERGSADGLRVACIGAGAWGRNLLRNFASLGVLTAVCDTDAAVRSRATAEYPRVTFTDSVDEIFRDTGVKAVAIATPAITHGPLVRDALLAGKDVFVEKPLCTSVAEAEELVGVARQRGRVLMVGHLLWYHPAVLKLKELIDGGELGRIQYVYSNRLNLGKFRREENILWSFAPHDISVILGLLGEAPSRVDAQGGRYLHDQIADVTVSLLSFPSGVRAHLFVSWLHPFKEQKLVVVGDHKMAVFNDVEPTDKLLLYPHVIEWRDNLPVPSPRAAEAVKFASDEPLRQECEHFLDCLRTRQTPRTDGEEAIRVLRVLAACEAAMARAETTAQARPPEGRSFFAHPSAFIDEGTEIGDGTTIWHVSHVMRGSRIGRNCRIGQNVVIGPNVAVGSGVKIQNNVSVFEGVTLEDDVFCGPSMVFTNVVNPRSAVPRMMELRPTRVGRGATLGANCTVVCGSTIGEYAFVAAGAVVTKDVPPYALALGVPARVAGWMCECGVRLTFGRGRAACRACRRQYRRTSRGVVPAPAATRRRGGHR
jgi:UDP-2-acetamido-3-amino-2,3-dideoxy-glucuronate N-acetyltransferase